MAVLALGGNLIAPKGGTDIHAEFAQARAAARVALAILARGYRLVLTHGNGPQVGQRLIQVEAARGQSPDIPLGVLVADTQGGMGYMIAQCLANVAHADRESHQAEGMAPQAASPNAKPSSPNAETSPPGPVPLKGEGELVSATSPPSSLSLQVEGEIESWEAVRAHAKSAAARSDSAQPMSTAPKGQTPPQVVAIVTQVEVDPHDPAILHPTKPVGPFYDAARADVMRRQYGMNLAADPAGRGFRRVVPSPRPVRVVEIDAVRTLLDAGFVVIACGGGGVPVYPEPDEWLEGIDAVIDKDLASAVLARQLGAELFVILTDIPQAALNFRTPNEQALGPTPLSLMRGYLAQGHFAAGSMGPKIEALCEFKAHVPGAARALVTTPERLLDALDGHFSATEVIDDLAPSAVAARKSVSRSVKNRPRPRGVSQRVFSRFPRSFLRTFQYVLLMALDISKLKSLVADHPNEFLYRFALADKLAQADDPDWREVILHARHALTLDPGHIVSHELLAKAHLALGELTEARAAAQKGLVLAKAGTDPVPVGVFSDLLDDIDAAG